MANGDKPTRTTGFVSTRALGEMMEGIPKTPENEALVVQDLINRGFEVEEYNAAYTPFHSLGQNQLTNFGAGLIDFGKDVFWAVTNPGKVFDGFLSIAAGAIAKTFPEKGFGGAAGIRKRSDEVRKALAEKGLQSSALSDIASLSDAELEARAGETKKELTQPVDLVLNHYADRYGSIERFGEMLEREPVEFLSDALGVVTGGASILSKGAKAAKLSPLSEVANSVRTTAMQLDPVRVAIGAPAKVTLDTVKKINGATRIGDTIRRSGRRFSVAGFDLSSTKSIESIEKSFNNRSFRAQQELKGLYGNRIIEDIWSEVGFYGDPEQIIAQARNLSRDTKAIVDRRLGEITKKFKSPDILRIFDVSIDGLKKAKSSDLIKIRTELKLARQKHKTSGLTLSEMNEVRRAYDDLFSSKVFTQGGTVKQNINAADLKKSSSKFRSILYKLAEQNGFPRLFEFNRQTRLGKLTEDIITPKIREEIKRSAVFLENSHVGSSLLSAIPRRTMLNMKFRTMMATRLINLSGKDRLILEGALETGAHTVKSRSILNGIIKDLRPVFPELRFLGEQTQNVEKMSKQEISAKRKENVIAALANIADDNMKKNSETIAQLNARIRGDEGLSSPRQSIFSQIGGLR